MKKIFILLILFASFSLPSFALEKCGSYYFIPKDYEIVSCAEFIDSYIEAIIVKKEGKFGVFTHWNDKYEYSTLPVDGSFFYNKLKVPAEFDNIEIVKYGFIVKKDGKFGYYGIRKNKKLEPIYDKIYLSDDKKTVFAVYKDKTISKKNSKSGSSAYENAVANIFLAPVHLLTHFSLLR